MSSNDNTANLAATGLLSQYQARLTQVSTSSVLIQLGLMVLCSLGTLLAFSILRPKNKVVYMPRYKYSTEDKRPPKLDDGLFAWLKPLSKATEKELLAQIGLDAVVFLRFLRMCRWMCSLLALLACAMLIPCDVAYNLKHKDEYVTTTSNTLAMVSISNVRGSWLYVHVVYGYLVTFMVIYVIYVNYKTVVRLRWQWFRTPEYQNSIYSRSIMMTHVGSKHMSDTGLQTLLTQLHIPYPTTAVHIGRRVGMLAFLIERHNQTVRDLEQVLVTYLKGGKPSATRPTIRIGRKFLGFGGRKVDKIDFYTAKIKQYELKIAASRDAISDRKPENYGFASFAAVAYAHLVAKKLGRKRIKGVAFSLAPPPQDIIWENLTKSDIVVFRQRVIGEAFMTLIATLYVIPLVALALLANLASLTQYVEFLSRWSTASPITFSAFAGVAPPLLSTLLQLALPVIMRALARFQAATTHQKLDRAVLSRYFAFLTATQFLVFSLLGVVFTTVAEVVVEVGKKESFATILHNFDKLPDKIQSTYLQQANYWLTWFPLRGFTSVLDLVQIVSLFLVFVRTKVWGRTPREIREWTKPPEFDYSVYSANVLLMILVAFVYAPLAPLVPLLASVAFFASSWIYKYQLMYISVTRCESGGRLWRMLINRVLFALCVMQAFLCLTIGLQLGWFKAIATLPPFAVVIAFKFFLKSTFDSKFTWYIPTGAEFSQVHQHNADARKNRLMKRFGHPALHAELFKPMIHKDHQLLLAEIYRGRIGDPSEGAKKSAGRPNYGQANYAGRSDDKPVPGGIQPDIGGLRFAAIAEHDLMYSQQQFLRERGDDEMSMASTSLGHMGHARVDSNAQAFQGEVNLQGYLENGPRPSFHYDEKRGSGSRAGSPGPMHEYPPEFGSAARLPYDLPDYSYGGSPNTPHEESLDFEAYHQGIPVSRNSTYGPSSQSRSGSPLISRQPPA
ncbi:hypothetical protein Pst134EB_024724 [Puccinia striiformis f. sp. tritici]|uniref:CSC1/OSCA1-like 7TM region domain-containing protein n=2 Tax=Puccinia striiformis f. sp. tritici TaxID=168172 RepID=A0A0L0VYQ8_9BASI|nr:hypothetical protein Pst134EB_024724 [Puccinia striiformis f. sp. tritici]KNF04135.1 hypothetical protein PSTG_02839 [Puccinia striiformis f. sp. tritici PST-78]